MRILKEGETVKGESVEREGKPNKYEALILNGKTMGYLGQLEKGGELLIEVEDLDKAGFKPKKSVKARRSKQVYGGPAQNINKIFCAGELPYHCKGSANGVLVTCTGEFDYKNYACERGGTEKLGSHESPPEDMVSRVRKWLSENIEEDVSDYKDLEGVEEDVSEDLGVEREE